MAKGKFDIEVWREFDAARKGEHVGEGYPCRGVKCPSCTLALKHRNRLVEENQFLAVNMAEKFRLSTARQMDLQDLIQAGIMGLITAIDRLNPEKGSFASYAPKYIRLEMQELSLRDQPVYRSRVDYLRQPQIRQMEAIIAKEGRLPEAEELGTTPLKLARHLERVRPLAVVRAESSPVGDSGVRMKVENLLPTNPSAEDVLDFANREQVFADVDPVLLELFRRRYVEGVPYATLTKETGRTKYSLGMQFMRLRRRIERLLTGEETNKRLNPRLSEAPARPGGRPNRSRTGPGPS